MSRREIRHPVLIVLVLVLALLVVDAAIWTAVAR